MKNGARRGMDCPIAAAAGGAGISSTHHGSSNDPVHRRLIVCDAHGDPTVGKIRWLLGGWLGWSKLDRLAHPWSYDAGAGPTDDRTVEEGSLTT